MPKKLTTEEFIIKAKEIHGDTYDYSLVNYKNKLVKIIVKDELGFKHKIIPRLHLEGNKLTIKSSINKTEYTIAKFNLIHHNKYDYSLVKYIKGNIKVKIICKEHGVFEQTPNHHLNGNNCPKCVGGVKNMNTETFIQKAIELYGNKYDYSLVNYINSKSKIIIVDESDNMYSINSINFLNGVIPSNLHIIDKNEFFIKQARLIHNDKYDYSLVNYTKSKNKIKIICPIHEVFEQIPHKHLNGQGCPICSNGYTKQYTIDLIQSLSSTDLLTMDSVELLLIIGQGNLPTVLKSLIDTDANTESRIVALQEIRDRLEQDSIETPQDTETILTSDNTTEFTEIDDVDNELTSISVQPERYLPSVNDISDLHTLDNSLYASMDEEVFQSLIQYKLRKLWNIVLNDISYVELLKSEVGGEYFTTIKDLFFDEYNSVINYIPPIGYSFEFPPNLMQKLTVQRLVKNKSYGNWSGTGAGKTLSFIIASREIDSRLTIVIVLNSTIKQTCENIKEVYPDSLCFTEYNNTVFDRKKHNYLVLNYEKFQQEYSEEMFQHLTTNNQIDFVVIDEVHNAKQRDEEGESIRRSVLNRLLGRIRESNSNFYTLVMSATPVINNLYEAKSLLNLMTGLEYQDLDHRRTLANALKIFQQLTLNGLRFIPKYNISVQELSGLNMSNLNIDGSHLLNELLELPQRDFIGVEKILLNDKLFAITPYLKRGTIIYSYYTTDFIDNIEKYVQSLGFKTGSYTGEESTFLREKNLENFISGKIDILIGSRPIGTGVDGLQDVSDRIILLTLPWTDSEYTQLKGRIYRQGSIHNQVEFIIPQVKIELDDNEYWSWDIQRLNLIKNKRTLADAAVDGIIPSKILPTKETMFSKSQDALLKWQDRIIKGEIINDGRKISKLNLYPEITDSEDRNRRIVSEINEVHRKANTSLSSTTHKEYTNNPESWFRYHALRKERMETWEEIPYEYIATKIKNKNHIIADYGCGENKFKDCVLNKVYSFDHIAFDDSVIACDMSNIKLENESIDVTVFSLSLWGINYEEYIKEAYRVLNYGGVIYIAEPSSSISSDELRDLLIRNNFGIVGDVENRGKFIYIKGLK